MAERIIYWQQLLRADDIEDRGRRRIWEPISDGPMFVRIESRSEYEAHQKFNSLVGKVVRITVEVVDG